MSPRSQEKIEQIRSQSITKILNAAFELMARNGYEATSISQIASKAGVSKGLMYNYFASKEELLQALIHSAFGEADMLMSNILTNDPKETLKNLFDWYFTELRERPQQWRLITELTLKIDKFDFVQDLAKHKMKEFVLFITDLLKQIGWEHATEEAQLIAGLFDGIGIQYLVIRKDYPLDEIENYLIRKYCSE